MKVDAGKFFNTVQAAYMGRLGTGYACLLYPLSLISLVHLTGPGGVRKTRPGRPGPKYACQLSVVSYTRVLLYYCGTERGAGLGCGGGYYMYSTTHPKRGLWRPALMASMAGMSWRMLAKESTPWSNSSPTTLPPPRARACLPSTLSIVL